MKRTSIAVCVVALFVASIGVSAAYAQSVLKVNIPFEFHAGTYVLPAGNYRISTRSTVGKVLTLTSAEDGKTWKVPYITRLARRNSPKVDLAFDKIGNVSYLSEIHLPDQDGYALEGAKAEHSHVDVTGDEEVAKVSSRNR